MTDITIVIPCYNEAAVLPTLATRLREALPLMEERLNVRFRLLFVDDGSRDDTVLGLETLDLGDIPAEMLLLSRNFGKEAALTAGIEAASGDALVLMDADLQHPPERIGDLIEEWRNGHDVVYYFKRDRKSEGIGRSLGARIFYWLTNAGTRLEIPSDAGDFRLLDADVAEALRQLPERERFLKGLYAWVGFRQKGLPYDAEERQGGDASRFNAALLTGLAIDGLTSFSVMPIRIMSLTGLVIAGFSALYVLWIVIERLIFGTVPDGFASIVVLTTFFGGLQMLCLGLIGEYIGKTLMEAKRRPNYVIRARRHIGGPTDD